MHATLMLHRAAGSPPVAGSKLWNESEICWLCGAHATARALEKDIVLKDTFMDHDKCAAPLSQWICEACAWSFSEHVQMDGREKLQRLRTYSHFVISDDKHPHGAWLCFSKAQKAEMKKILLAPPAGEWLGVIANSGQKHIIFRAPVSFGASPSVIQFEEQQIAYAPRELKQVLYVVEYLLALGFSKTEIERDDYLPPRVLKAGLATWQNLRAQVQPQRGSALLALALFLSQKPGAEEEGGEAENEV